MEKGVTRLAQYNNGWYKPGPFWKRMGWLFINLAVFNSAFPFPGRLKVMLLRGFGAAVGKGVVIKPGVNIKYPWFLRIGDNVWIGERVWIDNLAMVSIGDNVCISQGAFILTGNHDYGVATFDLVIAPVELEEGVWIGARAIVCPGVTCRSHAVLTVAAVATSDLESYAIYRGVPAVKVKERKFR